MDDDRLKRRENLMIGGPSFFDVPVYRLTEDEYYEKRKIDIEKQLNIQKSFEYTAKFYLLNPKREEEERYRLGIKYGGAWDYNEIIGVIQLHFVGTQVRGEYWQIGSKRVVKTRYKVFEWKNWKLASETEIPPQASSEEIYSKILEYLEKCKKELKGRYLDTRQLEIISPHMNWRELFLNGRYK